MSADRATYVDSSALVKLAVCEQESAALRRYLSRRRPLASSALARTEVIRALLPLGPEALRRGREVLARIDLLRLHETSSASTTKRGALLSVQLIPALPICYLNSFGDGDGFGVYQLVDEALRSLPRERVIEALAQSLASPIGSIRSWSMEMALDFPDPRLVPNAVALLSAADPDERVFAGYYLADFDSHNGTTVAAIREAVGREEDEEIRSVLRDWLLRHQMADQPGVPSVIERFDCERFQLVTLYALGESQSGWGRPGSELRSLCLPFGLHKCSRQGDHSARPTCLRHPYRAGYRDQTPFAWRVALHPSGRLRTG